MHKSRSVAVHPPARGFARFADAIDALCGAIAGFALFAGTRAFTFTALLGWREPVLGGAGLMLLAVIGWLRWRWRWRWRCRGKAGRVSAASCAAH